MIIKMTEELRRGKDEEYKILEVFNEELDSMEKNQIQMKNIITKMKNKLVGNERSSNDAEEQFNKLKRKKKKDQQKSLKLSR